MANNSSFKVLSYWLFKASCSVNG